MKIKIEKIESNEKLNDLDIIYLSNGGLTVEKKGLFEENEEVICLHAGLSYCKLNSFKRIKIKNRNINGIESNCYIMKLNEYSEKIINDERGCAMRLEIYDSNLYINSIFRKPLDFLSNNKLSYDDFLNRIDNWIANLENKEVRYLYLLLIANIKDLINDKYYYLKNDIEKYNMFLCILNNFYSNKSSSECAFRNYYYDIDRVFNWTKHNERILNTCYLLFKDNSNDYIECLFGRIDPIDNDSFFNYVLELKNMKNADVFHIALKNMIINIYNLFPELNEIINCDIYEFKNKNLTYRYLDGVENYSCYFDELSGRDKNHDQLINLNKLDDMDRNQTL